MNFFDESPVIKISSNRFSVLGVEAHRKQEPRICQTFQAVEVTWLTCGT